MTAWSRKTWKFLCEIFAFFFWKNDPYSKILEILFQKFSPPHQSTLLCSHFVKFVWQKMYDIVSYYWTKKFRLPLKMSLLHGSRLKSARVSPQQCTPECSRFHPNPFTFGRVIVERVNTAEMSARKEVQQPTVYNAR